MVYLKRLELSNFKSFGNTTRIPLRPGFTVVSGPNGSGKSNILDALLFALGLASSRGMRAERLPDLVNHSGNGNGHARRETSVTVTFALDPDTDLDVENSQTPDREWSVTRRLRVTKEGNYSSTYYINGQTCTQSELHEQLQRLRIYPEGYNVVLQGDVTRIITMSSRERREIIDELAGVAEFDRKIGRARETLETVRERQERCQILEQELVSARDRAATERHKAEKYRNLKAQIEEQQGWETVLTWKLLQQQAAQLETQIASEESESRQLSDQLTQLDAQIAATSTNLEQLNGRVKALGEDEQLAVASQLATQQAQHQQLQHRATELTGNATTTAGNLERTRQEEEQYAQILAQVNQEKAKLCEQTLATLERECQELQNALAHSREQANAIASASEAWVQQQTALNREISALQQALNPQRTEQAQLLERQHQLQTRIAEQTELLDAIAPELANKRVQLEEMTAQVSASEQQVQTLARQLTAVEQERQLQQDTQTRLLKEQRDKQRQLDKLEATSQAQQEAQGTYATQAILQADIPGVCGLVAQLGQVEPRYQLALETAAGGRLAYIVVEDDAVAAVGIELLKQKRAGRATFLPLNKIQPPRLTSVTALQSASGFIDYAVKLIECEPRYQAIFAYVFGNTAVFDTLSHARPHLGKNRIVTLEGELLESSGAMSGGSRNTRSTIHFGRATSHESAEMTALRQRLQEIEEILDVCSDMIAQTSAESQRLTQALGEARQQHREQQWQQQQLEQEIERLQTQQTQAASQQARDRQELASVTPRLEALAAQIPQQEAELAERSQRLAELEQSQTPSEWQRLQAQIKAQEAQLQERQAALGAAQQPLQGLENQRLRLEEKITTAQQRQEEYRQHQAEIERSLAQLSQEQGEIEAQIAQTQATLNQLAEKLGTVKSERDRAEEHLRSLQLQHQQQTWQQQKLSETLTEHRNALASLQEKIQAQQAELPDPLPELPQSVTAAQDGTPLDLRVALERLQQDIRNGQKRLQAMEPVNMLALEEYERLQARLEELTAKLTTLEAERSELLLRIENFTTRRLQAFQEAFAAVDRNFQTIFATLSEGDGYLQLDNPDDPSNSGLTLIAHPKGKPVRRLHSMSGGEKSLTALSFIFALQRYRPSPFYAFDEVDMFLDGANVERLAKMIKQQAEQAQFIVVSLRRPMIESATHTIGVTQARGAYTQVLGINL